MLTDSRLTFERLTEYPGVEVIDRVEQLRYQLYTSEPVSPTPVPTDGFHFPVGSGFRILTDEFVLPSVVSLFVRDADGGMVSEIEHLDSESFGPGSYILELSTQIKTYIEVEGPVTITANPLELEFEFEEATAIDVGVRSRHNRPATTITTTRDPVDMMAAISTFGSALKSTSPERSFPTLRGHPPAVELSTNLNIPDVIQPPETDVRIEAPPSYDALFPLASLSYYLGAEITPAQHPRLVTESGFEYDFSYPDGFGDDVAQVFKQVFLFDCLTRTEGFYQVDLYERNALAPHLDFDWATLYEQSVGERVETYLSVPYALVEGHIPEWRLTAHVEPTAETVEQLPFVVDDLAVVRTVETRGMGSEETSAPAVNVSPDGGDDILTRSTAGDPSDVGFRSGSPTSQDGERMYVEFDESNSLEQAWLGEGIPVGASKLIPAAFRNRFDREVTAGDIGITIVLNDTRMAEEQNLVDSAYGDRENLPFDVTVRRNLTVEALREQFRKDRSFLHYIGHTNDGGFECADGQLDASTLEETEVDAFFLNACNSYEQGVKLIEAGAIGGIVTLSDVFNDGAVRMGETIARLLNAGFPLRAALTVARDESVLGGQYIVVGDGGMMVTQAPGRAPVLFDLKSTTEDSLLKIRTFATDDAGVGTMYTPYLNQVSEYFLSSGVIGEFSIKKESLGEFLDLADMPIRLGDDLRWTSSVDVSDLSNYI
jgi:hypothetical protein